MAGKRVAVIGASGYGGLQTLRLLQDHPEFVVTFLGGERSSGKRWSELVPFLPLPHDLVVQSPDPAAIAAAADLAVLSLPNGLAAQLAPALLELGVKVVDLSADYRYRSLEQWREVYAAEARQVPRSDGELCAEAVYGLVEWDQERIARARLVAAPGCFPTASLLALTPLLKQGLIETAGIVIDAKTGTSGGGRAAKEHQIDQFLANHSVGNGGSAQVPADRYRNTDLPLHTVAPLHHKSRLRKRRVAHVVGV
jgi:N-acetyl-gamma-glutamyl-phosphate reductase